MLRSSLAAALTIALLAPAASAAPRDEVLRLAPPDAALLLIVQNARDHARNLGESPFAAWFPQSNLGKQFAAAVPFKQATGALEPVFTALGVTPEDLLNDVFGDAVVFAFTPGAGDDPKAERAILLVRPRKPETLAKLVERLNDIQMKGGEVKAVVRREHSGGEYFERQKPNGGSDYYCFRGSVFAFSASEADVRAVIDRNKAPLPDKEPENAARLAKLGVAEAFVVALIHPRALDSEVRAVVARARPDEKPFLDRFQEAWLALDTAAVYVALGSDLEAGIAVRFRPGALTPGAKVWLTGPRQKPEIWQSIPDTALFAAAGRFKASELIETLGSLAPAGGKNPLRAASEQFLGPVFGKEKLPKVLAGLGPNWAVWAEPPPADSGFLPVVVAAVQVDSSDTARPVADAVRFGFQAARIAYNSGHSDQIELIETPDGDVTIVSLVNEKGFPPGFRPSFAIKGGYLVTATSPDAIRRFREPKEKPAAGEATILRLSGSATRAYLQAHRDKIAAFLASHGHGEAKELQSQLEQFAAVLEPIERIELAARGDDTTLRLSLRLTLVKPLKK